MAKLTPERKQYSVALIGTFNPLMFQPEWFGRNNVISPEEIEFARNQSNVLPTIVTPQLTIFRTSQLSIRVEENSFQVVAEKEPLISVKDFVKKTFEKLGGLTIRAFGYNYSAHYEFESIAARNIFADKLTPKQYWNILLGKDVSGDDRKGGLAALQMYKYKEDNKGQISVVLQPSAHIKTGIFITCNDHTNIHEDDSAAEIVMEIIDKSFDESFLYMEKIQNDLIAETTKDE